MISREIIAETINKFGTEREHLMLILRELESKSGANYLDAETLAEVAAQMNIPESAVAGFTGFYTMFSMERRAKYVVRVCKSGPCHVMGSSTIFEEVERLLGIKPGESTADGVFHLEACECLGVCSVAPAIMVNYDLHGNLNAEKLELLFDKYRSVEPEAAENSGPEIDAARCVINDLQAERLLALTGKIDPRDINSFTDNGGYAGAEKALGEYTPAEIIDIIKDSGLRGRGGAGFPAGMKWSFVTKGDMQKYVICNADEGEPGTYKDRILMEGNPHLLIEGMIICGYAIGAAEGYIYIRGEFRRAINLLRDAIDQARAKGFLGSNISGSGFNFDIFIKEGGGAYVCGEETSLINSMEGRRGYPRFKPPFPGGAGFKNLPSNVNNVETFVSIPLIIANGADWYKEIGPAHCTGTKLYSLSGKLNRTGLVELPMGATLRDIIEKHGAGVKGGKRFKFAHVGGSAGGILGEDLMDLPLDFDSTLKAGVTLGSGVVMVADGDTCAVDYLLHILDFFEHESCGQCVPCRVGTSHLKQIALKIASGRGTAADIDAMVEKSKLMKSASLCALGQSPVLPVTTMLKYFRVEFDKHCDPGHKCPQCERSVELFFSKE